MRFRKIALALFACMALGAFATNAAQAAEGDGWTIGTTENQTTAGTLIPFNSHERVSCKKHGTSSLVFTSTLLGTPVELTATGIDCLEKAGSTNAATIDNGYEVEIENEKKEKEKVKKGFPGHSEGVLTFTNVTVNKPAHCSVGGASHDLTTGALTDKVKMDTKVAGSTVVFDEFFPETTGGAFVTITLEGSECALAGEPAAVKGTACGEAVHTNAGGTGFEPNKTGTLTKVQTLLFGSAQQTTGACALTFGGAVAQLTGAVDNELSGTNAGKPFGSD